ncbi:hypothetical protein GOC91_16755 [Sinorhizobium medicae]|uniref:Uncharacterized protein n=2 Tax=Sinorhizobium medicae TaxID=110321 RepID=A0A508X8Y6_9HYPH|nr:hypothetical protein Smed_4783 [Sinorhizobium medicae WSM419]MDX0434155.1 hypothetical protein [Sinorhizobium medicae]MDX0456650.1 hypothetical protein [Sinorhizobium medicae]MDX0514067.1 hypothetical protein [Sinorhizobium medicae]MDX0520797.1 hypothetical protein [Sinorhizobium medicae]
MKAVENTLNSLSIDTRVMREILQRIEASQRDGAQLRRDDRVARQALLNSTSCATYFSLLSSSHGH